MTRLLLATVALVLAVSACSKSDQIPPRPAPGAVPAAKKEVPDPRFKPFPHEDPKTVTLPSGVKYFDFNEGIPNGKAITENDQIKVYYAGWLENGVLFDGTHRHGAGADPAPSEFGLGAGVIQGFREGFTGMVEGSRRLIYIPSDKGYGAGGSGSIPPNSNLVFEVRLVEITGKAVEDAVDGAAKDADSSGK